MTIDNKESRMSMSWKALASGKPYGENDAKIYRSQTTQMEEEVSNSKVKFKKETIFHTVDIFGNLYMI